MGNNLPGTLLTQKSKEQKRVDGMKPLALSKREKEIYTLCLYVCEMFLDRYMKNW